MAETRDFGQIPRVARLLAATYNGQARQIDLFELRAVIERWGPAREARTWLS